MNYKTTVCSAVARGRDMDKLKAFYLSHNNSLILVAGLIFSGILMLPYLLLRTGSIVTYHDQLDGELINYILTAKHLFSGIDIYPEIMNGLPSTGAVPPAPLFVLLYVFLKPFSAFLLSQWIVYITGFLGMYLLIHKLTSQHFVAGVTAVVFMLLPFYPVYGLCIPGQPLLLYSILCLYRQERRKTLYLALILLYSLSSSLVLVGFACLLTLGTAALILTVRAIYKKARMPWSLWLALAILLAGYLTCNLALIRQVLFPALEEVSHKTEILYSPQSFPESFWAAFSSGTSYAEAWPEALLPACAFCLLFLITALLRHDRTLASYMRKTLKKASCTFAFILSLCVLYAFYQSAAVVALRNSGRSALASFNLGRILWLLPTAWCILAGYLLSSLCPAHAAGRFCSFLRRLAVLTVFSLWGFIIFSHSPLKLNISKLLKGNDYYALDWGKFFASDIFEQIEDAIGKPKDSYRVVSLGIYPAAAAYNGFYCLDGYSNNYPLPYKHTFREIMAGELAKSEYIRDYFDNWGNRCYLFTAEYGSYCSVEKKWNGGFHDLSLNTKKLKELGCEYIFAATWILNADELGLTLLRPEAFATEKSWYNIYVYTIN